MLHVFAKILAVSRWHTGRKMSKWNWMRKLRMEVRAVEGTTKKKKKKIRCPGTSSNGKTLLALSLKDGAGKHSTGVGEEHSHSQDHRGLDRNAESIPLTSFSTCQSSVVIIQRWSSLIPTPQEPKRCTLQSQRRTQDRKEKRRKQKVGITSISRKYHSTHIYTSGINRISINPLWSADVMNCS